ncbi:doublesex- and mab-3-related transcription factor C1-like isoform X1 [Acinonyx jubatus]|uniref:Doublesex- and mab-3-related transcription factor C1-like isoform X1 n=2 Tax=Acinonyx jubatus TaxID=32536 RepID=A0ABM3NGC1_ACIJB|nr:doublesex- and mab-3-related transcription factor C1-like isoform X1 [Acinonyx jubatus]XP_053058467.1 doublesex- and mab-3-related transcription factor C1-like isoform X1 [Acinonyx jubatus]
MLRVGDHVAILTSTPGPRTMDPNEMPAVPCCPSDSPTGLETRAPWGIELGPKRTVSCCARCYNHGLNDQTKDQEHSCPFQACECHKCAFFSDPCRVLPAESALKREQGACLKRHLTQGLITSGASPPKAHSHVQKLTIQGGVVSEHPRRSADWSGPKIFVSILDSSSLEDATHNFSFQEDPQDPCPVQHGPEASDQDSVSASSEWQRKLEAAEALLMLRNSSQASSGSISLLQPCVAAAPAGDEGPQPSSSSLRPRPASSISLPIGHLGCISLLS